MQPVICDPCKVKKHHLCPGVNAVADSVPPTGLSPEGNAIQRTGLCTCQHRVPK